MTPARWSIPTAAIATRTTTNRTTTNRTRIPTGSTVLGVDKQVEADKPFRQGNGGLFKDGV